jgi:hypothetical protein
MDRVCDVALMASSFHFGTDTGDGCVGVCDWTLRDLGSARRGRFPVGGGGSAGFLVALPVGRQAGLEMFEL